LLSACSKNESEMEVGFYLVEFEDVPGVYESLRDQKVEKSYTTFMVGTKEKTYNVQFSFENGIAGIDWVLLSPANIADKEKFVGLAKSMQMEVKELEGNGVKYLRIDESSTLPNLSDELPRYKAIPLLCMRTLENICNIDPESEIELLTKGVIFGKETL